MTSEQVKALTQQYIMNTYGRFPVVLDHGQGATLYSPEGDAYIDCTSGIGVNALGYGNTRPASAFLTLESRLQIAAEVLVDGLFGVTLHRHVD